jgi:hypothetical protein
MSETLPAALIVTPGQRAADLCLEGGYTSVHDATYPEYLLDRNGRLRHEIAFFGRYVIMIPQGGEAWRDRVAITLGDDRCRWAYLPPDAAGVAAAVATARPMWTDEIARMSDIPSSNGEATYVSGFDKLDAHGFRFILPAFMPIVGPYGSGKSVLLRQLLAQLWLLHGWKFLLTSFEERVKPRYERDLRRHLICGGPQDDPETGEVLWRVYGGVVQFSPEVVARADAAIEKAAVFLRRKRNTILDLDRLLDRIEFAVKVHGVKVIAIDPVNELDHIVPKDESKTDYMGRFIMKLKALADDYGLLMICALHPPKDGVEKRLARNSLLTLNDGADTAHWGNKADIGWCVWRDLTGPTYLHCDKLKDHETMGKPFMAELLLNELIGRFRVGDMGYHILRKNEAD